MKTLRVMVVFIVTLSGYLGFMLLGWGLNDLKGFFSDPARLAYALIVVCFAALVGIQSYPSLAGIQDGKDEIDKRVHRQSSVGLLLLLLLLASLVFLPYTSRRGLVVFPGTVFLSWLGAGLCGIGYFLIFWSGLALGRQYSAEVTIQKDHQLITSGPYHLIRHPRYLGILLVAFGLTLLFHTWLGLAVTALAKGLILFRIQDEEDLMHSHFGKAWEEYCQHSWRLVPHVF
jgi:protein-S-isoprenylcysteine O-methyltransferase Ste14